MSEQRLCDYLRSRKISFHTEACDTYFGEHLTLSIATTTAALPISPFDEPLLYGGCGSSWTADCHGLVSLAETVERAHFFLSKYEASELKKQVAPPGDISRFADRHVDISKPPDLHWMICQKVSPKGREIASVPAQAIIANWCHIVPEELVCPSLDTAGCAFSPRGHKDAELAAVLELVERHSILTAWFSNRTPSRIDIDDRTVTAIQESLEEAGIQSWFLNVTDTKLRIPTVVTVLHCVDKNLPTIITGSASKLCFDEAVHSSLREALQMLPSITKRLSSEDFFEQLTSKTQIARALWWASIKETTHIPTWLKGVGSDLLSGINHSKLSHESLLQSVFTAFDQIYFCDVTEESLSRSGFAVVRAFIPEVLGRADFDIGLTTRMPRKLGYRENHLVPHPFA